MTCVIILSSGNFNSSFKKKTKYHLHNKMRAFHPTKMISKQKKMFSEYKIPSAPHNTTQYLLSNYEVDPKQYQNLYEQYNNSSMMGNLFLI